MKRRLVAVAALGLALTGITACSAGDVDAQRLDGAVGRTFARMYALHQADLGQIARTTDSSALCTRNSAGASTWSCTVHYPFPDGHVEGIALDVEVQPIGCYTATAPTTLVGPQRIRDTKGRLVTNPLFAFDGCFSLD